MKIAFFEDINERHVRRSLIRSLRTRGHDIVEVARINKGIVFETAIENQQEIFESLENVVAQKPDILINFMAACLPPNALLYLKSKGVQTCLWLNDDPVLYDISYKFVVEDYDLILNCGGENIIDFYEKRHDIKGVNFPFWTDNEEFPYLYDKVSKDYDVVFLGTIRGKVRRGRYQTIASIPERVQIIGTVDDDPARLSTGWIRDQATIVQHLSRGHLALNIPQFFRDYEGDPFYFPELADLGNFEFPSRVIQYMAVGLPCITYGLDCASTVFPEMLVAADLENLHRLIREELKDKDQLGERAEATHKRFQKSFSADARAKFLEMLVTDDHWRTLSIADRARLFAQQ